MSEIVVDLQSIRQQVELDKGTRAVVFWQCSSGRYVECTNNHHMQLTVIPIMPHL